MLFLLNAVSSSCLYIFCITYNIRQTHSIRSIFLLRKIHSFLYHMLYIEYSFVKVFHIQFNRSITYTHKVHFRVSGTFLYNNIIYSISVNNLYMFKMEKYQSTSKGRRYCVFDEEKLYTWYYNNGCLTS